MSSGSSNFPESNAARAGDGGHAREFLTAMTDSLPSGEGAAADVSFVGSGNLPSIFPVSDFAAAAVGAAGAAVADLLTSAHGVTRSRDSRFRRSAEFPDTRTPASRRSGSGSDACACRPRGNALSGRTGRGRTSHRSSNMGRAGSGSGCNTGKALRAARSADHRRQKYIPGTAGPRRRSGSRVQVRCAGQPGIRCSVAP